MSAAATSVLLVEDNRADARLLEATLQDAGGHRFRFTHVQRLAGALAALAGGGVDVVLLDLNLPDSQGLDTLAELQRERPDVPVVVLTGLNDEELAVKAVQAGAQDYLPKEVFDGGLLARLIRHAIERHQIGRGAGRHLRVHPAAVPGHGGKAGPATSRHLSRLQRPDGEVSGVEQQDPDSACPPAAAWPCSSACAPTCPPP